MLKVLTIDPGRNGSASECVILDVVSDCNLKYYMIADSTYTKPGYISNELRHTYWFADTQVKAGDMVCLFTGKGKRTAVDLQSGHQMHLFFWGLSVPVWNNTGDTAVVLRMRSWESSPVPPAV